MASQVNGVVAMTKRRAGVTRDRRGARSRSGRGSRARPGVRCLHTDLHYREGGINDEFPFLLGHEAAGVVESVGPTSRRCNPGISSC